MEILLYLQDNEKMKVTYTSFSRRGYVQTVKAMGLTFQWNVEMVSSKNAFTKITKDMENLERSTTEDNTGTPTLKKT
jgi:hypothetical protein